MSCQDDLVAFGYRLQAIEFSNGTRVEVPRDGVLAIVGPNNAGKSGCLREITSAAVQVQGVAESRLVLRDVVLEREGTPDELVGWLGETSFSRVRAHDGVREFRRANAGWLPEPQARNEWQSEPPVMQNLVGFLQFHGGAENRLGLLGGSGPYDTINDAPGNPMQVLFADPELMKVLSETAYEAFGSYLTLSQGIGINFDLYMGETDVEPTLRPSPEYVEALRRLPMLAGQGDGIRSFMGLMLAVITAKFPLVSVDEPEAFLHPPQARLLGRKLATSAPDGTQVVVATHNLDVLHGLLDPVNAAVKVVRIVRDGNVNRPSVLEPADLRAIWADPLLRYSNVLEGLFHRGVILAEADSDCLFYTAVLESLYRDEGRPPHDLLFVQSNGKHRFPLVVRALRAVAVPVAAIADIDVLDDAALLRSIVLELGGNWEALEELWRRATAPIDQLRRAPDIGQIRQPIIDVLDAEAGRLSVAGAERIRDLTKVESGWKRLQKGGVAMLDQGDPARLMAELLQELKAIGLHVVPVGALERWVTEVGGHGPSWVSEVLRRRLHEAPGLDARRFIQDVAESF
jgi:AAA domain, putative AbiEii toxin, Type IV TA system